MYDKNDRMEELDYNNEQRLLGDMWARFQVIRMSEGQKPNRQYEIERLTSVSSRTSSMWKRLITINLPPYFPPTL